MIVPNLYYIASRSPIAILSWYQSMAVREHGHNVFFHLFFREGN